MEEDLFGFVVDATKENYLRSREIIVTGATYNPYSDDLKTMELMLGEERYEEVVDYHTFNTLLSPRAHLIKRIALIELGKPDDGNLELILAQKILECMDLTGDGTEANPYLIIRISDERDYLSYIGEEFASQSLLQPEGRYLDMITTASGKELHFDITECYRRMMSVNDAMAAIQDPVMEQVGAEEEAFPAKKKWWKFWA